MCASSQEQPQRVVFVGGPTGSGKSSLVRALSKHGDVYLEVGERNPHLMKFVTSGVLDAYANQCWFLNEIEQFALNCRSQVAIIDQHPFGIGWAYTQLFVEEGLISKAQAASLARRSRQIYGGLSSRSARVLTVTLSATTDCLWTRLGRRLPGPRFPIDWVRKVNRIFQEIVFEGSTLSLNAEELSIEDEQEVVERWLFSAELIGGGTP